MGERRGDMEERSDSLEIPAFLIRLVGELSIRAAAAEASLVQLQLAQSPSGAQRPNGVSTDS